MVDDTSDLIVGFLEDSRVDRQAVSHVGLLFRGEGIPAADLVRPPGGDISMNQTDLCHTLNTLGPELLVVVSVEVGIEVLVDEFLVLHMQTIVWGGVSEVGE